MCVILPRRHQFFKEKVPIAKVGHELAPYDPTLSSHHCCRHQTRESVCREAASFKRAYRLAVHFTAAAQ